MSLSKRMKSIVEKVDADKIYSVADALKLVKENAKELPKLITTTHS